LSIQTSCNGYICLEKSIKFNNIQMRNVNFILVIVILGTLLQCKKSEKIKPETIQPGKLGLTQIINQRGRSQRVTQENTINFNLGRIKGSQDFFFMISNTGQVPITDIQLESNHPKFEIFPKTIDKLTPSEEGGVIPLLKLSVIHGERLNGTGFQGLLPKGENEVTITIKGKTQDKGGTIEVSLNADIKINASVMDIKMLKNGQEIDMKQSPGITTTRETESGLIWVRTHPTNGEEVSLENTGNVDLDITFKILGGQTNTQKVTPGEKFNLGRIISPTLIILDSQGTITDKSKIQIGTDGKGYFVLD